MYEIIKTPDQPADVLFSQNSSCYLSTCILESNPAEPLKAL